MSRTFRVALLALAIAAAAMLVYFTFFKVTPEALFEQAMRLKDAEPARSQVLLLQSIAAAEGDYPKAQLALAESLISQGRCLEALGSVGAIADLQQCDPADLHRVAQQALGANCTLLASVTVEAAVQQQGPHQGQAFALLIRIKIAQQKFSEASEASVQWSEREPDNAEAWIARGRLHQQLYRPLQAAAAYRTALGLRPQSEQADHIRQSLLSVLLDIGELREARNQLEAIATERRGSERVALSGAKLLHLEGELEAAKQSVEQLLERCKSTCLEAKYLRGLIRFDLGHYDSSIEDFRAVIAQQPNHKEAHFKLGRALLAVDQPKLAEQHLQISQRLTQAVLEAINDANP